MKFDGTANVLLRSVGKLPFIYGTAWKKNETSRLVKEALASGFTAVDTAAQPRHYREDLVGEALRDVFKNGSTTRDQLYIQTKYTPPSGQDPHNMPYDSSSPLSTQLHASLASSFNNLRPAQSPASADETYLDCLLLHSPLPTPTQTLEAWRVLESYVPHRIRALGISNVTLPLLEQLYAAAKVKPAVVQNRFYPATHWDGALRRFCREKGVVYQSFWTLTGNPRLLTSKPVRTLAEAVGVSREVALYSLVIGLDVAVLNGTTNKERIREDLEGVKRVGEWAEENRDGWGGVMSGFRGLVEV